MKSGMVNISSQHVPTKTKNPEQRQKQSNDTIMGLQVKGPADFEPPREAGSVLLRVIQNVAKRQALAQR